MSTSPTCGHRPSWNSNSCSPCRIARPLPRRFSIGRPAAPPWPIEPQYGITNGNVGGTGALGPSYTGSLSSSACANTRTGPRSICTRWVPIGLPFSSNSATTDRLLVRLVFAGDHARVTPASGRGDASPVPRRRSSRRPRVPASRRELDDLAREDEVRVRRAEVAAVQRDDAGPVARDVAVAHRAVRPSVQLVARDLPEV